MIIDLHVHTNVLSPCSDLAPEEAIQVSKLKGLDGICFTEHNKVWKTEEILRLSQKEDFLVLSGMEVDTREGHILVFGLHEDINSILSVEELRQRVAEAGGFMIAAHPFRGFLMFGSPELNLKPEQAAKRMVFQGVDALEIYSGKVIKSESHLAQEVCQLLNMKGTAGSDAHTLKGLACGVTIFENQIRNEAELITELKAGRFTVDNLRRAR